ncbi:signal peptide containing protein [Theileria equi strain WA]|uniref:Signal peptide containing protein n=1 Tax=Theileria equi strain WA TaxID=1537102 RepID=L1LBB2_THEEQ|nr:signal peptide containing protein [Theileria equi strain WA]EKX72722.1 signal peptide containing protein [Theileria equi strain WA]|eukprot:XP_004832174.1 signal peptide containing protein [Theileria equi strain WA]
MRVLLFLFASNALFLFVGQVFATVERPPGNEPPGKKRADWPRSKEEELSRLKTQLLELQEKLKESTLKATNNITERKKLMEISGKASNWLKSVSVQTQKSYDKEVDALGVLEGEVSASIKNNLSKLKSIYHDSNAMVLKIDRILTVRDQEADKDTLLDTIKEAKELLERDEAPLEEFGEKYDALLATFKQLIPSAKDLGFAPPEYSVDDVPSESQSQKWPTIEDIRNAFFFSETPPDYTKTQMVAIIATIAKHFDSIISQAESEYSSGELMLETAKSLEQEATTLIEQILELEEKKTEEDKREIQRAQKSYNELLINLKSIEEDLNYAKSRIDNETLILGTFKKVLDRSIKKLESLPDNAFVGKCLKILGRTTVVAMISAADAAKGVVSELRLNGALIHTRYLIIKSYYNSIRTGLAETDCYQEFLESGIRCYGMGAVLALVTSMALIYS